MRYIILALTALVLTVVSCNTRKKEEQADKPYIPPMPATVPDQLPDMAITLLDGKQFSMRSFTGKNILIMFQPDCDHCQREAKQFSERIDAFAAYQLYFVSTATADELRKFSEEYGLNNRPNVHFGNTTSNQIIDNLGPIDAPSVYIYHDHKLIKNFNGETDLSKILQSI